MKLFLLTWCLGLATAGNIVEELTKAGATTLVEFVEAAGLAEALQGEGPFSVAAPDNAAFAKLPVDLVATLKADTELLKKVLLSHVVSGMTATSDMMMNDMTVDTMAGIQHRINVYLKSDYYDGFITINGKRVKKADIMADNGVIHMVTDVIYPFTPDSTITDLVASDARFSTLLAAVSAAGLADTLASPGPITVFAPTNAAFDKVPAATLAGLLADKEALTKVLLRHVVPGTIYQKGIMWTTHETAGGDMDDKIATQVFKNQIVKVVSYSGGNRAGARVEEYDILASNGVIHAIDTVI